MTKEQTDDRAAVKLLQGLAAALTKELKTGRGLEDLERALGQTIVLFELGRATKDQIENARSLLEQARQHAQEMGFAIAAIPAVQAEYQSRIAVVNAKASSNAHRERRAAYDRRLLELDKGSLKQRQKLVEAVPELFKLAKRANAVSHVRDWLGERRGRLPAGYSIP